MSTTVKDPHSSVSQHPEMSKSEALTMLELYVHTPAFDKRCAILTKGNPPCDPDYSPDISDLEQDSSVGSPPYTVSEIEAHFYYFGIRGPIHRGPKLIFRTSKDVFTPPLPEQGLRNMSLLPVYEHQELSKQDSWAIIRSKIVELLDQRNIRLSSIDVVRFSWEVDDELSHIRSTVITPVTIWIGVLPGTLAGEVAFHSSNDILDLLNKHGISDIDIAYREAVVRSFSNLNLFAPASNLDPLKSVLDPVTTALSLPIAGLMTLRREGTMGFYFRVNKDLYAVTSRHVLFPPEQGNHSYLYVTSGPKKEVVVMGINAFADFLENIMNKIGMQNHLVDLYERQIEYFEVRSEGVGPNVEQAAKEVVEAPCQLAKSEVIIKELKKLYVNMKQDWTNPKNRVIGYVVWAPPITFSTTPHNCTTDICVIKLNKEKFLQNFRGNVLDLGTEIGMTEFTHMMYPHSDSPPKFKYPYQQLLELRGLLSVKEMQRPTNIDHNNQPMPIQYVIKRGLATQTTVGCLTAFESYTRYYKGLGEHDSVEVAVFPHNTNHSSPFSKPGDSGSIIVDIHGKFVALLTGGSGPTDSIISTDITYGSPMYWLWDVIKAQFPGANLYFDDFYDD